MKTNFLILALGATTAAFSQPVITASHLPAQLETEALVAETAGIDPGTPGPDKIWDFSTLKVVPVGVNNIVEPSQTPAAPLFNSATHCAYYSGVFDETFQYFRADASKLELIGEVYTGVIVLNYAQNPKINVQFPYTLNTAIIDTYQSSFDQEPIAFSTLYDAYGTLIMPFGTYQVIRQTIVENGQTDYIWYNVDPFFPIIQTAMADNTMGIMKNTEILNAKNFRKSDDFSIVPNPTNGPIEIDLKRMNKADIEIFDLMGKCISNHTTMQTLTCLNIDAPAGVYIVKITANDHVFVQKIVKH